MSGVWSSNNTTAKRWLARQNRPFWYDLLDTDAERALFDAAYPGFKIIDPFPGLYDVSRMTRGQVGAAANNWYDLVDTVATSPGTTSQRSSVVDPGGFGPQTVLISSASGLDNGEPEGTGMHTVFFTGMDSSDMSFSAEALTMDGASNVSPAGSFDAGIVYPGKCGSTLHNVGKITAAHAGGGVYSMINANLARVNSSLWMVPTGFNLIIESVDARSDTDDTQARFTFQSVESRQQTGGFIAMPSKGVSVNLLKRTTFTGPGIFYPQFRHGSLTPIVECTVEAYLSSQ